MAIVSAPSAASLVEGVSQGKTNELCMHHNYNYTESCLNDGSFYSFSFGPFTEVTRYRCCDGYDGREVYIGRFIIDCQPRSPPPIPVIEEATATATDATQTRSTSSTVATTSDSSGTIPDVTTTDATTPDATTTDATTPDATDVNNLPRCSTRRRFTGAK